MQEFAKIDDTFNLYEKRYELSKLAQECGIAETEFSQLSSKDKFLMLSYKLKETNRIHLASFFFGKLFELSNSLEALINKIDCLIELGEFEEAFRFTNIGFELYLEEPEVDPLKIEKKLFYQKAYIAFCTEKYHIAEWFCEESIIKYRGEKNFYFLLCAIYISFSRFIDAKKFFMKYSNQFCHSLDFLIEITIYLVNINQIEKAIEFVGYLHYLPEQKKHAMIDYINNYYSTNKNKIVLRKYFEKEVII